MIDSDRHTFFAVVCDFDSASGTAIHRELLVAINGYVLLDQLAERTGVNSASIPDDWTGDRAVFVVDCAREYCRRTFQLSARSEIAVVVLGEELAVTPAMLCDPSPQFFAGAIIWVLPFGQCAGFREAGGSVR